MAQRVDADALPARTVIIASGFNFGYVLALLCFRCVLVRT
jgi:hypothetical protein